jgi:GDPmannose 4,6-dehydratase
VSARVDRVALITGVAGQDGVYLARLLRSMDYRVTGTVSPGSPERTRFAPYLEGVEVAEVDIRDDDAMRSLLSACGPDEVYNLAARSSVGESWKDAEAVADVNGRAVSRLLESLLRYREESGAAPRFFQASSSEIYGVPSTQPQTERTPHDPRNPYGVAKLVAHEATVSFRESHELFACNGILFNHESPLRPTSFVTRKITRAAAEIAAGRRSEVGLGNLDVRRDWGAAEEYVRAMWLMLQRPEPADYVIASGEVSSLRDFVEIAFDAVRIDDPWAYIRQDPAMMRPADVPQTWGDPSRAKQGLGWTATTSRPQLIRQMVAVDVERVRTGVEESPEFLTAPT